MSGQYEFVAVSPEMSRVGLDPELLAAIVEIDGLIRDMRTTVAVPNQVWDRDTAVKLYLIYISILVDSLLPDIIMSAIAAHDLMVLMKLRLLLEYAANAAYFSDNPDYALFMMTIDEAAQVHKKLKSAGAEAALIDAAEKAVDEMKQRFPQVAGLKKISFDKVLEPYGDRSSYVWLYKAPSTLIHGDPEGIRTIMELLPDGQPRINLQFPLEQVNAMIVDAGTNTLMFCNQFLGAFWPGDVALKKRFLILQRTFLGFVLRHKVGRDEAAVSAVREEMKTVDETLKTL